jgi:DNA-binding beta-propeller fold protein YncE
MPPSYELIKKIALPQNPDNYDFSWIDKNLQRYYLCDRTNACVDVIDAAHDTFLTRIPGFVGLTGDNKTAGPSGLEGDNKNRLYVGDGDSSVKVVDLKTNRIIATVFTGGQKRIDLVGYDPQHNLLVACNNADTPNFLAFISTKDLALVGRITYPTSKSGLELPLWNPHDNRFYVSILETTTNPGGEIAVVDPVEMKVINVFPMVDSGPQGMTLSPDGKHIIIPCSGRRIKSGVKAKTDIVDASNGKVLETLNQVGGCDQTWYNPGDNRHYLGARAMTSDGTDKGTPAPCVGVIDGRTEKWLTNIPAPDAKVVCVNPRNNHIFVPIGGPTITPQGVFVFAEK